MMIESPSFLIQMSGRVVCLLIETFYKQKNVTDGRKISATYKGKSVFGSLTSKILGRFVFGDFLSFLSDKVYPWACRRHPPLGKFLALAIKGSQKTVKSFPCLGEPLSVRIDRTELVESEYYMFFFFLDPFPAK